MSASDKPNVLLLAVDSLRTDAVFGDRIATPNFDRFAHEGASFTQCVSTTTSTTPSFSSMLTGCYPPKHGVRGLQGYRLNPNLTTLAAAFGSSGYTTHAEVTGPLLTETGILNGFTDARHRQGYKTPFFGWRDEVLERMHSYVDPWFMLLHIWEVHRPYRAPPDFTKRWDKTGYEAAVAATDEWLAPIYEAAGDNTIVVITGDHGEDYPDTPFEQKLFRAARKARRKLNLARWAPPLDKKLSGLVVGHGFALWEHLVRVPLIVAGPGIPSGVRRAEQVRHVDLFPTLVDLCGLPIPDGIDGRSLKPLLEGGELPAEPAYMEAVGVKLEGKRIEGARTPDWKLLRPGGGRPALYKLDGEKGPNEKRNLYGRFPEVARPLEEFIDRVRASEVEVTSGMTDDEEAIVEQHLRDLGYL